jgi:cytoskeletal protein CcmA (bactofilin family)
MDSTQIPQDAGPAWAEARTRVAVGRSVNVSGKLIFHEPVRIEGRFRGEVRSLELVVVGEEGMIEAISRRATWRYPKAPT